jgi:hypothetical protein
LSTKRLRPVTPKLRADVDVAARLDELERRVAEVRTVT